VSTHFQKSAFPVDTPAAEAYNLQEFPEACRRITFYAQPHIQLFDENQQSATVTFHKEKLCAASALSLLLLLAGCGGGGGGGSSSAAVSSVISGTITVAAETFIDSDTNDPDTASFSVDNSVHPQELRNPFIVGGYVNADSDQEDHYLVPLSQGQTITLSISDHDTGANLDLFLNDSSGASISTSQGTTSLEIITVPVDAAYEIVIAAVSGGSKYVLSLGSAASAMEISTLNADDFLPGEIVVEFKETNQKKLTSQTTLATAAALGLMPWQNLYGGPHLIRLQDDAQRRAFMTALGIAGNYRSQQVPLPDQKARLLKQDTLDTVRALRRRADVLAADPNYIRRPAAIPNDPLYADQWHFPLINLPAAWNAVALEGVDISAVTVAVLDTGVDMDHPDLAGSLLPDGYDFVSLPSMANDGDGIDDDPNDPGDSLDPSQSSFHGTHIAGTIGAVTDNSIGVAGITWDGVAAQSKILPIRVLGVGGGTSADIIQGVRYAAGLSNISEKLPTRRADIISLSLVGEFYSQSEQNAFTAARNAGVICIAAAGNDSSDTPAYPASYTGVIAVGGVDADKELTDYSNFGPWLDVAAPGGDEEQPITSTWAHDTGTEILHLYASSYGTSMAAPHVAGVIALMKAVDPDLTPADLDTLLSSGLLTEDLGQSGRDDSFGNGLIDAQQAVQQAILLTGGSSLPVVFSVTPATLYFGTNLTHLTVTASNDGDGAMHLTNVAENISWLTVAEDVVDGNKLGTYRIAVNRTGLADGFYSGTVFFNTNIPSSVEVRVNLIVDSSSANTNDAGLHHIHLLDATDRLVAQTTAAAVAGTYSFTFPDVAAGNYSIIAGTDSDNDGVICQAGEACGGPVDITYSGSGVLQINFITNFIINRTTAGP
jgi:serine protease